MLLKKETITSFENISLRLSGMRITEIYELLPKNGKAELSLYYLIYCSGSGEDEKQLQKRVVTDIDAIIALLNDCNFIKWDGFNGPNPRGVLDGTMFRLNAVVNGDRKIYAEGSNNFPKHYHDFVSELRELLRSEDQNGVN